jgi:capsular polysaccharide biosynthesis protein
VTETEPPTLTGRESAVLQHRAADAPAVAQREDATGILRRNWKLLVLPAVVTMLFAWLVAALQPKRYRAGAIAAVTPLRQGLQPSEVLRGVEALDRRTVIATVAALASTPLTLRQAYGSNAQKLNVSAAVLPNTNLFRVDVEGTDPAAAAAVANRIPELLSAQTRAMFNVYDVTTVSAAVTPTEPFAPRAGRAAVAGLLIGLFIGAALTYALHALRTR